MKDLGYKRTPTEASLRVTMPDGTKWDVPVQAIADDRDAFYAEDKEDTIGFIRDGDLDNYDIKDWAANNMNWSDVSDLALEVLSAKKPTDYEEGWRNGDKEIIGKI